MEKNHNFTSLNDSEQLEIKNSLDQEAAPILLRAWNESCRIFLDYLNKSPHSPFINVESLFARHKFQASVGNLPHIHAMLKIVWHLLTMAQRAFFNYLIRASLLDIVRVD